MPQETFLSEGEQAKITENIKNIATEFTGEGLALIEEILKWVHKNLKTNDDSELKKELFRRRTADQIISDGFITGCTDNALAFIALARAKDIPTKYVETIRRKWLDIGDENMIEGHIFAEVEINGKWHIIDPMDACLRFWYSRWIVYARGLDSWDIGIRNFQELQEKFIEFRKQRNALK